MLNKFKDCMRKIDQINGENGSNFVFDHWRRCSQQVSIIIDSKILVRNFHYDVQFSFHLMAENVIQFQVLVKKGSEFLSTSENSELFCFNQIGLSFTVC